MPNSQLTDLEREFTKQLILLSRSSEESSFTDYMLEIQRQEQKLAKMDQSINEIVQNLNSFGKNATFIDATLFLSVFEIAYVSLIDNICLLYTKNGHDLYDSLRNKYAKDCEAIGKVSTFTKFKFLKEHRLGAIVRDNDNELRNKIAHFDFVIIRNGKITACGEEINILEKFADLMKFVANLNRILANANRNTIKDMDERTAKLKEAIKNSK